MKKLWFAGLFLILTLSLCTAQQLYVNSFYKEMTDCLETAENYYNKGDKDNLSKQTKEIQQLWEDNNELLFTFSNHTALNELGQRIRGMSDYSTNKQELIAEAKSWTKIFYENEKISFSNIF